MNFPPEMLQQLNPDSLKSLDHSALLDVAILMLIDLKELHDRLNQNPKNSSQPPSSQPAFLGTPGTPISEGGATNEEDNDKEENPQPSNDQGSESKSGSEEPEKADQAANDSDSLEKRKPGKQEGSQGFGRTQVIPPHAKEIHRAGKCESCSAIIPNDAPFVAIIGFDVIDIGEKKSDFLGIKVVCTRHLYGETECECGHKTLTTPGTGDSNQVPGRKSKTQLSERRFIGPGLASFIVSLSVRMQLSRRRIREFLMDWFGLNLSVGTIDKCIHETGLALLPVYIALFEELRRSPFLMYVDETPWKVAGKVFWLWVFVTPMLVVFTIAPRKQEVVLDALTDQFVGWLMSDGLMLYRIFPNRLRCLAHLLRKAQGLAESLDEEAREFGQTALGVLATVIEYVDGLRSLDEIQNRLKSFKEYCEMIFEASEHKKTSALAFEFLNDWDAIWKVVEHPDLPLTNNEAERALRHWVIARLLSHGTRTEEGSQVVSTLASVIETCRKRGIDPWPYIAEVIAARRTGLDPPPLPAAATVATAANDAESPLLDAAA